MTLNGATSQKTVIFKVMFLDIFMRYVHPDNAMTWKTKNDPVRNLIASSYHEGIVNNAAYVFQIILLH
jgi:hypothetical protein